MLNEEIVENFLQVFSRVGPKKDLDLVLGQKRAMSEQVRRRRWIDLFFLLLSLLQHKRLALSSGLHGASFADLTLK